MSTRYNIWDVRHGESERNAATILAMTGNDAEHRRLLALNNESEWALTKNGVDQALMTADWLHEHCPYGFDALYSSDYRRAIETSETLELKGEWRRDSRLRERSFGDFTGPEMAGLTTAEYLAMMPICGSYTWKSPAPGSQSISDLVPSSEAFLKEILGGDAHDILLVTHGGRRKALQVVLARAQHVSDPVHALMDHADSNCSIMHYCIYVDNAENMQWSGYARAIDPCAESGPTVYVRKPF